MKFLTATIFLFIMTAHIGLFAQSLDGISIEEDSMDVVFLEMVKNAEQEKAEIELLLIKTRTEIAQLERTKEFLTKKDTLKGKERELAERLDERSDWIKLLKNIQFWPNDKRKEEIDRWKEEQSNVAFGNSQLNEGLMTGIKGNLKKYIKEDESFDMLKNAPNYPCQVISNFTDSSANVTLKKTTPTNLFTFTDEKIRKQFVDRDFISCNASIVSSVGGMKTLQLNISVASANAINIFGTLKAGEFIAVKLIDGKNVFLKNRIESSGQWIPALQSVVYRAEFQIGIKQERLLRAHEADSIIIRWTKAQDEYQIYEMDFFINHFYCLENG